MSMITTSSRAISRDPGVLLIGFATDSSTPLRFAQNERPL